MAGDVAQGACKGVPDFPEWAEASERYRDLFNAVAEEMGIDVAWTTDNPDGTPNVPEAEWGELVISPAASKKYGFDDPGSFKANPLLAKDLCTIRAEIERRRQVMAQAGVDVYPLAESGTFTHHKLDGLSPAERRWLGIVAPAFAEEAQQIYGLQAVPQFPETHEWMHAHADETSNYHYERILNSLIPEAEVTGFADAGKYASSVPWFPNDLQGAGFEYGMMWPQDFTKAELEYINAQYGENDPIRLPYTMVSRITQEEADQINQDPSKDEGRRIEWARRGPDGKWYRVVNMAFDDEVRPHFLRIASLLRANADIVAAGATLDPAFKRYTLEMADALEHGDFPRLLKADMAQKGDLFLTFFPHEGYWSCNTKYPFMFEVGIKERSYGEALAAQGYAVDWLGQQIAGVAHKAGLEDYTAPTFDAAGVADSTVFFWPVRTGAFLRVIERDPGGHDYPKRSYPGIDGHRVVVLLDTLETWVPRTASIARAIFGQETADMVSFKSLSTTTFWHEAGHGAQLRPEVVTLSGKPVSSAFGNLWGVLVEPWADASTVLAYDKLRDDGKVTDQEFRQVVLSNILYNVVRYYPRAKALSDDFINGYPHATGSSMYLGWLYHHGAIVKGKKHLLAFNEGLIAPSTKSFVDRLTTIAAQGDAKALDAFVKECVAMIPEGLEKAIVAKKAAATPYRLIGRGDLQLPAEEQP